MQARDPSTAAASAPDKREGWLVLVLVVLFAGVVGSFGALARWQGRPGDVGAAPTRWPAASQLTRSARTTIVQFITPGCPCSRASLHELGEVAAAHADIDTIIVVADDPDARERTHAAVVDTAQDVPRARLVSDPGGSEASLFGAKTSGHTLVFAADGRRLYAGGITVARGHEGDNAGLRAVLAAVDGRAAHEEAPTFGCALDTRERIR